jgi:hypothetical protein
MTKVFQLSLQRSGYTRFDFFGSTYQIYERKVIRESRTHCHLDGFPSLRKSAIGTFPWYATREDAEIYAHQFVRREQIAMALRRWAMEAPAADLLRVAGMLGITQ